MKVNNYIIGKSKRAKGTYIFAGISGGYGAGILRNKLVWVG
ncbi:hypothetical protein NWE61_02475 [Mycoplasmopsis felis]|nr:hypothetical protein [Mycoplasmopsis felis]MCU9934048.1 hypothetical protein [Mycoplasmopsis felis]